MRLFPLLALASLGGFVAVFILSSSDALERLGHVSGWSLGIFLCTLLFAAASLLSIWAVIAAHGEGIRRGVRWYSGIVSIALLIALIYLAWWGVIGLRTWA
jgi:hypothetical protein